MLNLASSTEPAWGRWAAANIDEVLLDHAHCEKKAASTAVSLIFRYPERPSLMIPLSRLAREELAHFEQVIGLLRARGREFCRQRPSPYAARLLEAARSEEPARLLDTLLCCALIEARSCERMQRLAEALEATAAEEVARAPELAPLVQLYRGLLASEARHHATYVELARALELAPEPELRARLHALAEHEAEVLRRAPRVPRMHN
ncbi:MAG: tRNA-(ms[2]io[6]A)-hydroxylase [Myxococcales bacterium]|nr:tRNA-(ms[2]io[6]A)-hydroxylase [Myxococcales bacterium]MCB9750528.1 tRNA-(ms[2]io[6]A)-hydroxylase [Myxococcales bacterium]